MTHTATHVSTAKGRPKRTCTDLAITSYTAAGEALVPKTDLSLRRVDNVIAPLSSTGHVWKFDAATLKMRAYRPGAAGPVSESWPDVKGGIFANVTADAASAALNDAVVLSLTDATVATAGGLAHAGGLTAGITNPNAIDSQVVARNIVVAQNQNGAGGTWAALSALEVTGTYVDGTAFVLDVPLQTTAIADTKFRLTVGDKAIATITKLRSIRTDTRASRAGPASSRISVGVGTIFGLRARIGAESDVTSVRKDNAAIEPAVFIATPSQVDMGADVADNVDIVVNYEALATSLLDREAGAGENVGSARVEASGL